MIVYYFRWFGNSNYCVHKNDVCYSDKELARKELDRRNNKLNWFQKLMCLQWSLGSMEIKDEVYWKKRFDK